MNLIKSIYAYINYFIKGGVYYARKKGVTVGENCRLYTRNFGSEPFLIKIGDNVTITPGVNFISHDGSGSLVKSKEGRRYYYAPIELGNNIMVGINSIILPGVKIEDNVIVAAGSVVSKSIPKNSIVAGVPAKIIGKYTDFESKAQAEWVSDKDLDLRLPYMERILKVVDKSFKPYMK